MTSVAALLKSAVPIVLAGGRLAYTIYCRDQRRATSLIVAANALGIDCQRLRCRPSLRPAAEVRIVFILPDRSPSGRSARGGPRSRLPPPLRASAPASMQRVSPVA